MRFFITYLIVFCLMAVGSLVLISATPAPERHILGKWEQTSWAYEKLDLPEGQEVDLFVESVKRTIGRGLIIHQAESWEFLPNNRLRLQVGEENQEATWRIKGRGHLLQIVHENGVEEHYTVDKLDDDTLKLYFETDIQARGIAKLIFTRNG